MTIKVLKVQWLNRAKVLIHLAVSLISSSVCIPLALTICSQILLAKSTRFCRQILRNDCYTFWYCFSFCTTKKESFIRLQGQVQASEYFLLFMFRGLLSKKWSQSCCFSSQNWSSDWYTRGFTFLYPYSFCFFCYGTAPLVRFESFIVNQEQYYIFSQSEYNLQHMQSYQLHIISEQLKRRHPYLEPPFKARYDSTEVYKAVFDRAIPKLIEILLTQNLTPDRYTNALITLNEIASDEVEKSNMIEQGCVGLASAFSHCKVVSIRREATLLLGLLLSTNQGLSKMGKQTFTGLKALLFDPELQVRNAVSWAICRIILSRIGAEILCKEQITKSIVQSFLKYSSLQQAKEQYFIIYLLVSFKHLLAYDSGIKFSLGTGLTKRLKQLTATKVYSAQGNGTIHQLSLLALSNIAMNLEGKIECVQQEVIAFTEHFLQSQEPQQVGNTASLIMFTSINLLGKKQCIYNREGKVDTTILVKIIKLLSKQKLAEHTRRDVMEALKIISQETDGFLAIADYMSKNSDIKHIEQIFGSTIIIPLAKLLPNVAEIAEPPTLPSNKINDYKAYAKAINYFMQKDPAATQIALKDCVDLASKLVMFMCYRGDKLLQEGVAQTLNKLCAAHNYSIKILKDFLKVHGNSEHKISKTSVMAEVKRFENLSKKLEV